MKKKYLWNCWLGPFNKSNQQIKLHQTSWQYPLIDYLDLDNVDVFVFVVLIEAKNKDISPDSFDFSGWELS